MTENSLLRHQARVKEVDLQIAHMQARAEVAKGCIAAGGDIAKHAELHATDVTLFTAHMLSNLEGLNGAGDLLKDHLQQTLTETLEQIGLANRTVLEANLQQLSGMSTAPPVSAAARLGQWVADVRDQVRG